MVHHLEKVIVLKGGVLISIKGKELVANRCLKDPQSQERIEGRSLRSSLFLKKSGDSEAVTEQIKRLNSRRIRLKLIALK